MITDEHLAGRHEMALLALRIINNSHIAEYAKKELFEAIIDEAVGSEEETPAEPAREPPPPTPPPYSGALGGF